MPAKNELDRIMTERALTAPAVAKLIQRSPKTVRNWRTSVARQIPEHALAVLRAKLSAMDAAA